MSQRQIEHNELEIDAQFDDATAAVDANERTEQDILTEIGASADHADFEIRVFQVPETGTKRIWLFNVPGAQAKTILERLRDQYGTGTYEARIWQTINGKTMAAKNHKQTLMVRRGESSQKSDAPPSDALSALVKQQGDALQMLMHRLTQAPTPAPVSATADPVAMFGQMAAMAEAMRKMMGPPVAAATSIDPFAMLQSVVGLVREANSDGRDKSVIEQVMEFANSDAVKMVVQNMQMAAPQVQPQLAAPPMQPQQNQPPQIRQPAPVAAQPQRPQPAGDIVDASIQKLGYLVTRAAKGSDVVTYAEWTWDNFDPEWIGALLDMPNPVSMLAQYHAPISEHHAWFAAVMDELRGMRAEALELATEQSPLTPDANAGQMPIAHTPLNPDGPNKAGSVDSAVASIPSAAASIRLDGNS